MAAKDDRGRRGEECAAEHLTANGYRVLDRNWRCAVGEIDIVALDGDELVVVEVKTRRSVGFGHPFEAVNDVKRDRLWQLAQRWRAEHRDLARGRTFRLDVIGILGDPPGEHALEHWVDLR